MISTFMQILTVGFITYVAVAVIVTKAVFEHWQLLFIGLGCLSILFNLQLINLHLKDKLGNILKGKGI